LPQTTEANHTKAPLPASPAAEKFHSFREAKTFNTQSVDRLRTFPEGWKVQTTNTYDLAYTWFRFPTPEMEEMDDRSSLKAGVNP